jgi:hypothetical protein
MRLFVDESWTQLLVLIETPSGAKARVLFAGIAARLKSCPDTKRLVCGEMEQFLFEIAIEKQPQVLRLPSLRFGRSG